MKYFFILGRHADLSLAEIESVLRRQKNDFTLINRGLDFVVLEVKKELKPHDFIQELGGTIKIGKVISEATQITADIISDLIPGSEKKVHFGFSLHGFQFNLTKLGLETKKILQDHGCKVRYVTSRENPLSSVIVQKNHLLDQGAEIVMMKINQKYLLGQTLAVQPFELLSKLDYGRPARDSFSGMLPPKLAQIMINLAQCEPSDLIYDPFCGSGTILQQALLLKYNVLGSDISPKAIKDSEENLNWLTKQISIKNKFSVFKSDITKQGQLGLAPAAIVTEPYLGPALRGHEKIDQVEKNIQNLTRLYKTTLQKFAEWLKPQGTVIMVIPKFQLNGKNMSINLKTILPARLKIEGKWEYAREGQHVIREIYKLTKS